MQRASQEEGTPTQHLQELKEFLTSNVMRRFNEEDLTFMALNSFEFQLEILECLRLVFTFVSDTNGNNYLVIYISSIMYHAYPEERAECRDRLGLTGSTTLQLVQKIARKCRKFYKRIYPKTFITLEDASVIRYQTDPRRPHLPTAISFSVLKLLAEGQSWYNQYGFKAVSDENWPNPDLDREELIKTNLRRLRNERSSLDNTISNRRQARRFLEELKRTPDMILTEEQTQFVKHVSQWTRQIAAHPLFSYNKHLTIEVVSSKRRQTEDDRVTKKRKT